MKSLAQGMKNPTVAHMNDLKRLGRYLLYRPNLKLRYKQQKLSDHIRISVDSDHATDRTTRKSTTGMVMRLGQHAVRSSSNLQSAIGLNVSEAEFYALVQGSAHGLGMQAFLRDLGLSVNIIVESDSNSAKSFASRKGLGKQRHVQTRFLWIQERIALGHFQIRKVGTEDNVSDILTKSMPAKTLEKHLATLGYVHSEKSHLHKTVL